MTQLKSAIRRRRLAARNTHEGWTNVIVCVCRRISDQQIRQAAAEGAVSLECLQFELGVATQCGRCADCACAVLAEARALQRASHSASRGVQELSAAQRLDAQAA